MLPETDEEEEEINPDYNMNEQVSSNIPPPPPTEATTELNEESKFPLPSSPPPPKSSLEIKELPPLLVSPPFCRCLNGHHIKRSKLDYDWY